MKKFITLITVLSVVLAMTGRASAITPDIKANGRDGTVSVSDSSFSLTISLAAEAGIGQNCDWWLVVNDGSKWFYYNLSAGWLPGISSTHQGSLVDLNSTKINVPGLSTGSYTFYFGVDTVKNGIVDTGPGQLYYDSVVVNVSGTGSASKIPDTGQTTSFTNTFGEDSDYTINPPSYTDNGNGTVTDNVTALIWQQQDDNNTMLWTNARSYCNSLTLGGYSDWRLPTVLELSQIVHSDQDKPSINTTTFPNTKSSPYWSSTINAANYSDAWGVGFKYGSVEYNQNGNYVRCVRGGQGATAKSLTDNGNGTVLDNGTGLIWQQAEGGSMDWEAALNYCEGLSLAGNNDWRLPNKNELLSLADFTLFDPAIDTTYFPGTNLSGY